MVEAVKSVRKASGGGVVPAATEIERRWQLKNDVFKPGFELPTMSLEEYGEYEKQRMIENTAYCIKHY